MMSRILVLICCVAVFCAGCKKSDDATAQRKDQAVIDDKLIEDYVKANNLKAAKVQIGSADTTGVWYVIDNEGTGSNLIITSSLITVGYTGRILNTGKVIAQTSDFHPAYQLGQTIRGWQLGLLNTKPRLKKNAKVRLLMASRYAYGPFDQATIPKNSVLDFDIEIFEITN